MRSVQELTPGIQTLLDVQDGVMTVGTIQDCTAAAEMTQALHNEGLHGSSEMRHVGFIPNVFVEKYCNDNNVSYEEFMGSNKEHLRRVLNDPALSYFRVWKGRV